MGSKDLIAASAKTIILAFLLSGESYGYQIIKRVRKVSGGALNWSNAILYPVLHQMEKDGLIRSEWKISSENRMRKYYILTQLGAAELSTEKARWEEIQNILHKLLGSGKAVDYS